ncbi:hypothetical protein PV735_11305 [Streptomyces turgidiscabies]|uniref:hypothetical protein n=1 Tax=Streptomyces turgidiscabies TaxID=85558 RepID=UPI0005C808C0|nr:hypothetical protein [Streptomyces turgidiscabies]MDX3493271.1 hypothetical protein [Streptomyces turgidiscabies]GAQ70571.1 hypothetical protein T45_02307 [Streptomyces turgidiscabies]
MAAKEKPDEPSDEPSRTAGACVLVVLVGAVTAVVFAVSPTVGVLALWAVGILALWRTARRRMSDSSATPPPQADRPSCDECAGHELVSVAPLEGQKGMLIYTTAAPGLPNYTHIHIASEVNAP